MVERNMNKSKAWQGWCGEKRCNHKEIMLVSLSCQCDHICNQLKPKHLGMSVRDFLGSLRWEDSS